VALETLAAAVLPTVMVDEGFRAKPYLDANAVMTIGFGTSLRDGIDEEEAMFLLEYRLNKTVLACRKAFPWFAMLDDVRQGVIAQMAYQLGVAGVAGFRDMCRALACAVKVPPPSAVVYFSAAANAMLDSKWALHDSPKRAARRAAEMATGKRVRG
jgi:lysozyme